MTAKTISLDAFEAEFMELSPGDALREISAVEPLREPQYNEHEAVELALKKIPPVMTLGRDWFAYRDGVWSPIQRDIFRPRILEVLYVAIRSEKRVKDILGHIESRFQVEESTLRGVYFFDGDSLLLNVANGVLKVGPDTIEILPHDPAHRFIRQMAASYDSAALCPIFDRVLAQSLPDSNDRQLFQLFIGNTLLPSSKFETALICYGPGGTGKSTIGEAIGFIFGPDLIERLSMSQICDPKSYFLPKLRHAALNLGTELDALEVGESGNFKAVVSGEAIGVRPIYGHPFVMQTTAKLWFLSNHLPRFKSGTDAELRRMRFLRFDKVPAVKDPDLKRKLMAERDGIFQWALGGLQTLLSMREMPLGGADSQAARARFAISNDPLGEFVRIHCSVENGAEVAKEEFRNALIEFCNFNAIPCENDGWLFKQLWSRWPELKSARLRFGTGRVQSIRGIRLI